MKKYIKNFTIDQNDVEMHELSNLTPIMTQPDYIALKDSLDTIGQLQPIIMYRGKCIDGRHRVKAAKELGFTELKYINEDSKLTIEEIRQRIMNGYEQRRHQSKTQKSIFAYKELLKRQSDGIKTTQGEIAELFGVHINDISLVKKLYKLTSDKIIDTLFNGGKITLSNGKKTDNLRAVIKYFQTLSDEMTEDSDKQLLKVTDDEYDMVNEYAKNLSENHNSDVLRAMISALYREIGDK